MTDFDILKQKFSPPSTAEAQPSVNKSARFKELINLLEKIYNQNISALDNPDQLDNLSHNLTFFAAKLEKIKKNNPVYWFFANLFTNRYQKLLDNYLTTNSEILSKKATIPKPPVFAAPAKEQVETRCDDRELHDQIDILTRRNAILADQVRSRSSEHASAIQKLKSEHTQEIQSLQEQLKKTQEKHQAEISKLKTQIQANEDQISQLHQTSNLTEMNKQDSIKEKDSTILELRQENQRLKDVLEEELEKLFNENSALTKKITQLETQLTRLQKENQVLREENAALKQDSAATDKENAELKRRKYNVEALSKENKSLSLEISDLRQIIGTHQAILTEIQDSTTSKSPLTSSLLHDIILKHAPAPSEAES